MLTSIQFAQLGFLFCTSALFVTAFVLGLRHLRLVGLDNAAPTTPATPARFAPSALYVTVAGSILGVGLLVWRIISEGHFSPLSNHFDTFLVLALLLTMVVGYFRSTRHLRPLALFLLPMIAILLFIGGGLSLLRPTTTYAYGGLWYAIHVFAIVAGTLCFALGCVGGVVYLLAHSQLKHKGATSKQRSMALPSLASIEKFNQAMIDLGFPLLTVAIIAGAIELAQKPASFHELAMQSKVMLALLSWGVYAVLKLLPLAPQFRGPRAAWLWIVGFTLFIGGFVAANWVQ